MASCQRRAAQLCESFSFFNKRDHASQLETSVWVRPEKIIRMRIGLLHYRQNVCVARDRPEAGPQDLQKAWQAQQNALPSPPGPPQLHAPYPLHGARRLFLVIYCYHQHNPQSKPEKPASDAPDSLLQANLNPRNPTPKP